MICVSGSSVDSTSRVRMAAKLVLLMSWNLKKYKGGVIYSGIMFIPYLIKILRLRKQLLVIVF
jgi:hypothetical protein